MKIKQNMKYFFSFIIAISCFLQISLFGSSEIFLSTQAIGDSEKSAKLNALNSLSSMIISTISSEQTSIKSSNGKFNSSFKTATNIKSKVLLQGVTYDINKDDDKYKATAYLSYDALDSSIKYLISQIDNSVGDTRGFSDDKLFEILEFANFVKALLYYPFDSKIDYPNLDKLKDIANHKIKVLSYRLGDYGSITISDENNKDAYIYIEDKKYNISEEIFLAPKIYDLSIKKDGYKTINAKIRIYNDKYQYKKINLSPLRSKNILISIVVNGFDDLDTNNIKFKKIFSSNDLEITNSNKAKYKFNFLYEESQINLGKYIKYKTHLELVVYKNNKKKIHL